MINLEPTDADFTNLFRLAPIIECLTPLAREQLKVITLSRMYKELEEAHSAKSENGVGQDQALSVHS
jgi:hypothetical protein